MRQVRRSGTVHNVALFGQTQWHFNDPWSVIVGLRYDRESQGFRPRNSRVAVEGSLISDSTGSTDASFGALLPKFGIGYAVSDDTDCGLTVQCGYRADGSAINFLTSEVYEYDPEHAWHYEYSYRGQFVRRWLFRYRANVFYMDWSGQQVNLPQVAGNFLSDIIINAGESRVTGAELERDWQLTSGFQLNGALGIADTEFKDFSFVQVGDLRDPSGLLFPQAPGVIGHVGRSTRTEPDRSPVETSPIAERGRPASRPRGRDAHGASVAPADPRPGSGGDALDRPAAPHAHRLPWHRPANRPRDAAIQ